MKEKIKEIFSVVFNKDYSLDDVIQKDDEPNWDSLKHIELVMTMEEEFGVKFNIADIPQLDSSEKFEEKIKELL